MKRMGRATFGLGSHALCVSGKDLEHFIKLLEFSAERAEQPLYFAYIPHVPFYKGVRIRLNVDTRYGGSNQGFSRFTAEFPVQRLKSLCEARCPFFGNTFVHEPSLPVFDPAGFRLQI